MSDRQAATKVPLVVPPCHTVSMFRTALHVLQTDDWRYFCMTEPVFVLKFERCVPSQFTFVLLDWHMIGRPGSYVLPFWATSYGVATARMDATCGFLRGGRYLWQVCFGAVCSAWAPHQVALASTMPCMRQGWRKTQGLRVWWSFLAAWLQSPQF